LRHFFIHCCEAVVNIERFVGSVTVRLATLLVVLLSLTTALPHGRGMFPNGKWLPVVTVATGVVAFIGLIHSFRMLYDLWMRAATTLHTGMVTLLFGVCYLLVFFLMVWPFDLLLLRKSDPKTFWIRRRRSECNLASLQRMG
jgi:hypothetical protein